MPEKWFLLFFFWIWSNKFCIYLDNLKKKKVVLQGRPICKIGAPPDGLLQKKLLYHLQSKICCVEPSSLQDASPCGVPKQQEVQEGVRITGESYAFDHWEQRFQFDTVQCSERQSNRKRKEVWEENCSSVSTIAFNFKVLRKNEWRRKADEKCSGLWPAAPSILHACHLAAPTIVLYTPPSSFLSFCTEARIAFASGWILGSKYLTPSSAL